MVGCGHPRGRAPGIARGAAARPGPTEFLEKVWPGYPEWLAMLGEILAGNQVDPKAGWYVKGVARSRFDWATVRDRFDRDRDGKVARGEFPGPEADFRRLDRDGDAHLTEFDIGLVAPGEKASRLSDEYSLAAFTTADRNADGKATAIELHQFLLGIGIPPVYDRILHTVSDDIRRRFDVARKEGLSFLALSDFQESFDAAARRKVLPEPPAGAGFMPTTHVPKETLLRGFLRREIGAWGPGPALDAPAPDFTLETSDGRSKVTLSELVRTKPVVLIFGNHTCGVLRFHAGSLEMLNRRYGGRAHFVLVYTRESHPVGGWELEENRRARISQPQPRDYRERVAVARLCRMSFGLEFPVVVDTMDDEVGDQYSGMPIRMYLIDRQGKVAYKSGRGPFGFKPAELEQSLILLLQSDAGDADRPDRSQEPRERTKAQPIRKAVAR